MSEKTECEIFIAIDENGDWAVNADESEAAANCAEFGGNNIRIVKLIAMIALPMTLTVPVNVPDEAGHTIIGTVVS